MFKYVFIYVLYVLAYITLLAIFSPLLKKINGLKLLYDKSMAGNTTSVTS